MSHEKRVNEVLKTTLTKNKINTINLNKTYYYAQSPVSIFSDREHGDNENK